MKYFTIFFLINVILVVSFCNFGNEGQVPESVRRETALYLDSIEVFHLRKKVFLPVEGVLKPWKQVKLFLPDSARLISILVEPGSKVKQGDLLASLWLLNRAGENTPVDLTAPISGRIDQVGFSLNQHIPAFRPIINIINSDRLLFRGTLKPGYGELVKKGMRVNIQVSGKEQTAAVCAVNSKEKEVEISLYNKNINVLAHVYARGNIDCGLQQSDFLKARYFLGKDSLKIQLRDSIQLTLFPAGQSDSLVRIYPPLPGQNFIRIYQKNLDL